LIHHQDIVATEARVENVLAACVQQEVMVGNVFLARGQQELEMASGVRVGNVLVACGRREPGMATEDYSGEEHHAKLAELLLLAWALEQLEVNVLSRRIRHLVLTNSFRHYPFSLACTRVQLRCVVRLVQGYQLGE
jgi:hypothetical protein